MKTRKNKGTFTYLHMHQGLYIIDTQQTRMILLKIQICNNDTGVPELVFRACATAPHGIMHKLTTIYSRQRKVYARGIYNYACRAYRKRKHKTLRHNVKRHNAR